MRGDTIVHEEYLVKGLLVTNIKSFGFVEGDQVYIKNSEGSYEATLVDMGETGVYFTRSGIDRVFIPWSGVIRIYQTESIETLSQAHAGPEKLSE